MEHEDIDEIRSLYNWLSSDPEVLRGTGLSFASRDVHASGRMGPVLDVIEAVFTDGMQLASLVVAVASWRSTRPQPSRVRIGYDGTKITIDNDDPETVQRVLRALEKPTDPAQSE